MAEIETQNLPLTENPPSLPNNEPAPTANAPAQNSLREKIGNAVSGVIQKYKVGRGRPKKDGSPKISDIPAVPASPALPTSPAVTALVAPATDSVRDALFRRSVASAVKGILSFAKRLVRSKSTSAGFDEKFTDKLVTECECEPEVMSDFSEALDTVLKKYNASTEYAPEIALVIAAGRLGSPYFMVLKTLNAEIARRHALELAAKNPPAK